MPVATKVDTSGPERDRKHQSWDHDWANSDATHVFKEGFDDFALADELPFFEMEGHLEVLADSLDIREAVHFEHSPYGVAESLDIDWRRHVHEGGLFILDVTREWADNDK